MMAKYFSGKIGMLVLGVWLVLTGLLPLLAVDFPGIVMHALAIAAGVLILAGR